MMNDPLGRSPPPHQEMFPSPDELHHAFERMNMRSQPSPLDHGIRNLNAHTDISPACVGFTLTKVKKGDSGQPEAWSRYQRTYMQLSEKDLLLKIRNEKKKGISVQKKYLAHDFEGIKRDIVDREIELQNRLDPQFKYTLASLTTREGPNPRGGRMTTSIHVILERQPIRTRERSPSLHGEINDFIGAPGYPPHGRPPHAVPHEHPDPRIGNHQPEEPWVQVGRSEQPPPPPPPPHPQSHPQSYPPPHPHPHPHPQPPNQRFGDPPLHFMDAEDNRPMPPDSFGSSPDEHMRNPPPNHHGKEGFKANPEHGRRPKVTSLPSDHDSLDSVSDDSGFSGARTSRTGDTDFSDHGGQEYPKRAKPQRRRKDSRRGSDARRDRSRDPSRDRRRDSDYDYDDGLGRKDSLHRSRHRRDSEQKTQRPFRTHRRKSPAQSPNSSWDGSIRYVDDDYEFIPSRTHERPSPSRRNSQEQRPRTLQGRRFSSFSHPVAIHDNRKDLTDFKYLYTQLKCEKLQDETEALRRDNERMREQEKRIREQENERMLRRDRDRLDRRAYPDPRPVFPEMRYNHPRPQWFSRDLESNRFPF